MTEKLQKSLDTYKNKFNDDFPTYPLAVSRTDEEVIELIDFCINENKDVYQLGILEDDVLY